MPAPRNEKPEHDARFTFGLVGRISPEKGQDHFVRAAAELQHDHADVRFLICGDVLFGDRAAVAYRDSLDALAAHAPVERLGWRDNPGAIIAGLDALVVPSVREPATPRVIFEAFARGVAVLAYATGGIAEIVEDGLTGVLLPEPDHAALARTMRELAAGPRERLRHLGENGRRRWRERYTIERYSRDMLQTLTEAAEAPVRV